jgi:predicted metal-binding membrane protein
VNAINGNSDHTAITNHSAIAIIYLLIAMGWTYSILQVLTVNSLGSFLDAGLGMQIFSSIQYYLFKDPFSFESSLSFCTTTDLVWGVWDFAKAFAMWMGMIFAMMLPCIYPLIKTKGSTNKNSLLFMLEFVLIWLVFAFFAVIAQWVLRMIGFIDGHMVMSNKLLAACLLTIVAIYQLSKHKVNNLKTLTRMYKHVDFKPCCNAKTVTSGTNFGIASLKCCFPLMITMFAFGLMNIIASALLLLVMYVETTNGENGRVTTFSSFTLLVISFIFLITFFVN